MGKGDKQKKDSKGKPKLTTKEKQDKKKEKLKKVDNPLQMPKKP